MSRSQTPDLDRVEREERGETLRDERERRLVREQIEEVTHRMSTVLGRRSVARQLTDAGLFESPWSANNAEMAKKVGRLETAVELLRVIQRHCPKEWLLLEAERMARESVQATELETADE